MYLQKTHISFHRFNLFLTLCSCSELSNKQIQWECHLSISRLTLPCTDQNTKHHIIRVFFLFLLLDSGWDTASVAYNSLFSVSTAVCINLFTFSLLNLHEVMANKTILLQWCGNTCSTDHHTVLGADYLPFTTNPQLHLTDIHLCVR
jgi:hypothetical protein